MNELHLETSPYLLQHAGNPVHWKAWNTKSLTEAKQKNKLIIVSIGYSACHWCHVMEHESFEDSEVAQMMNNHFINIKIDREERPDVDAVYMKAVQIMTGRGGWPLNIVTLPDGRPVWGGTYFRKAEWIDTLDQLQEMYLLAPEKMIEYAEKLHQGIKSIETHIKKDFSSDEIKKWAPDNQNLNSFSEEFIKTEKTEKINQNYIEDLVEQWKKSFDWEFGGMASAPKFMMPNNYHFLMRFAHQKKDTKLLEFIDLTLTKMAYGGIFDTVGGGFSRYSVDIKWHVPHFEKMLYDNGQLVSLYSDAYKLTQNPLYKEIIEKTLAFVARELMSPDGGFYSALDADSLNLKNHLEEGAFYVWTIPELKSIIKEDFDLFGQVFNSNAFGLWEEEKYVLIQNQSLEKMAHQNTMPVTALQNKKKKWEELLYIQREKRPKPRLDDKCLTSWNAIMLIGYVDAYKALENETYLNTALKNGTFLQTKLWSGNGNLFHNYKNNQSTINGYLEDYSLVIAAFIALYQVTFDEKWLLDAKSLMDYSFDHFYDEKMSFFKFTSDLDDDLIATHYETEDNVIPASNSVMAKNLYQLSIYFNHSYYEDISKQMLQHIIPTITYPSAYSNWLDVALDFSGENKELAICDVNALQLGNKLNHFYIPDLIVAGTDKTSHLPFLENRFQENQSLFYICQNKTCQMPISDFQEIVNCFL